MSEIVDRDADPAEDTARTYVPGQRRRIYEVRPDKGMVLRFQARTGSILDEGVTHAGLTAALNPAAEDAGCGTGLLTWHREEGRIVVDGEARCPLQSGHHGKHITPDGLHVWADDEDDDE